MKVSITITGEETEVDKIIQENSIRHDLGIVVISPKNILSEKKTPDIDHKAIIPDTGKEIISDTGKEKK